MFVAVIRFFGNLGSVNDDSFGVSGVQRLAIVLSSSSMLLFAVLAFGVGTLARLAAQWALLRLTLTGLDAGSPPRAAQNRPHLT